MPNAARYFAAAADVTGRHYDFRLRKVIGRMGSVNADADSWYKRSCHR